MATYEEIYGKRVKEFDSDPTLDEAYEGQVWYNTSDGVLKTLVKSAVVSSASNMPTATRAFGSIGNTSEAYIAAAGANPGTNYATSAYEYDGSSWSGIPAVTYSRDNVPRGSLGTTSAGIIFGGLAPSIRANTELWNGSSWSESGDLSDSRGASQSFGTQTACVTTGGYNEYSPPYWTNATEEFDGSSWTSGTATPINTINGCGVGTSTAGIIIGQQETNIVFPRNPNTVSQYADKNIYAMFMQKNLGPPRSAGTTTLVHDFIDSYVQPRKAWQYNPATRRVRRAPDITYDTVLLAGGGIVVVDQYGGFNGAQDKYDWSYEGTRKMIVPANNEALAENALETTHAQFHLNPDYVRYEERDVHVVHANLKPGQRHLYASRTFYVMDDDFNMLSIMDAYDDNGELMRHQIGTVMSGIEGTGAGECNTQGEFTFDFATRTYTGNNQLGSGFSTVPTVYNGEEKPASFFTPDGLRRYAR